MCVGRFTTVFFASELQLWVALLPWQTRSVWKGTAFSPTSFFKHLPATPVCPFLCKSTCHEPLHPPKIQRTFMGHFSIWTGRHHILTFCSSVVWIPFIAVSERKHHVRTFLHFDIITALWTVCFFLHFCVIDLSYSCKGLSTPPEVFSLS